MDVQKIFLTHLRNSPLADRLDLLNEAEISYFMDLSQIQDSFRYLARHVGLRVAAMVIDEKGELDKERLEELKGLLGQGVFLLGPGREGDVLIYGHVRNCLDQLPDVWTWIRKFSPPLCNKRAEEVVRETLWPAKIRTVQTVHIRRAVVAAWLTLLRQTTGSCFATAPAILIQRNYPVQFFKDFYDLLSTGQLKRAVGGKEYAVPLSLNSGKADLQRPLIGGELSPGLRAALEAGEVAIGHWNLPEEPQSVEKYLRAILLKSVGITEEDLEDEEHLARIQMTPLLAKQTAVYYQRPSARAQKVAEWKKRFAKACLAFQAFTECSLLRTWEYTIASFCDVKTDFARWNLYVGLGMHPDHKEGVGAFLYAQVDAHLQKCNREIEVLTAQYEQEMRAVNATELMISGALSDTRRNQLKSELAVQIGAANSLLEMRSQQVEKAEAISKLFVVLMEQYDEKLQEYFQELFDPAILGEEGHLYDDSPAGFRLVYKHGRRDASQWTAIYTKDQYIDSLRDFFSTVEADIRAAPQTEALVSEITTALIQLIQEPEFIASAQSRSKQMGRRSPWDYVSGGTMETLLQSYCNRDRPFAELKIVPHSEEELLHFLAGIKEEGPFLMHSPTHAFIFYPGLLQKNYKLEKSLQEWDEQMQEHIAHRVSDRLPIEEKALFLHLLKQKPNAITRRQFRDHLIDSLGSRIKNRTALVDSVIYEQTPLFSAAEAKEVLQKILLSLGRNATMINLEETFFGSYQLVQIAKAILLESLEPLFSSVDWDMKIAKAMDIYPVLFADTNWSGWFFGFVVNPATDQLEFWRLNRNGTQGFPMTDWKEFFSESNTAPWVLVKDFIG